MKKREKVTCIYVTKTSSLSSVMDFYFTSGKQIKKIYFSVEDLEGKRKDVLKERIAEAIRFLLSAVNASQGKCQFFFNHEISWEMNWDTEWLDPHSTYRKELVSKEEMQVIWEALWMLSK